MLCHRCHSHRSQSYDTKKNIEDSRTNDIVYINFY